MRIGAHMSTSGGISKAVARGDGIGCEAIQIFGSSPQGWAFKPIPETEIEAFRQDASEAGIGPVFLHAIYLINLGTPDQDKLDKGIESLVHYMRLAADIDAAGVIVHPGSHGGQGYDAVFGQTVDAISRVLAESPEGPRLILENMAGMGKHIGAKFEELGRILKEVDSPRLGICLDTQHSFAAGYELTTKVGINDMISEFDQVIGLENLLAVHANDSKRPCGAGVDRHDNIGDGFIGVEGFETIMRHPAFHQVPFFLEVPGLEGNGPDKENIQILKDIRHRLDVDL